jgi:Flp pilus assembly protein TadD
MLSVHRMWTVACGRLGPRPSPLPAPVNVLKASGDEAFRAGEYATAIARFSHVLSLEPRFVAALSNRAAAHLASGDLEACRSDCTTALTLLGHTDVAEGGLDAVALAAAAAAAAAAPLSPSPGAAPADPARSVLDVVAPVGSNRHRAFVVTTLVRRGTAGAQLGDEAAALRDLSRALALDPRNAQVAAEVKRLQTRAAAAAAAVTVAAPAPALSSSSSSAP